MVVLQLIAYLLYAKFENSFLDTALADAGDSNLESDEETVNAALIKLAVWSWVGTAAIYACMTYWQIQRVKEFKADAAGHQ